MSIHSTALTTALQNLSARDPSAPLTRLACSSVDLLWVMSYTPGEGNEGTIISVNFTCKADLAIGIHVRLVVGRRAVSTQVQAIDAPGCGRWQLKGRAPSLSKQKSPSPMVPLTIQAVDKENRVIDSVTFGDFLYSDLESSVPPLSPTHAPTTTNPPPRPFLRINSGEGVDRSSKRRSPYSQPHSPPSSDSEFGSSQGSRNQTQPVLPTLRRASRQMGTDLEDTTQAVVLDVTTPLDNFCFDWEESELHSGRRLVRFRRLQDGNRLIVSAEKISQAEYDSDDIVISCIYREETDSCCVTSVDIIHLLQRLVDADFEVDEKNRIRRNLEGLRPTTVSKTRPGFETLFQRIMDFPEPKPRKIEKDVKVFDWKLLPHALDKILSKYSLCTSSITGSLQDEVPSPLFDTMLPQDLSAGPSPVDISFGDNTSHLPHEPSLDTLYLSHVSPIMQLSQPPSDCSSDPSPELHRHLSLPEDQLQSIFLDADVMQRYYSEPDLIFGVPVPSSSLPSPVYAPESGMLARGAPVFVGDQGQHDWATQPASDIMLISPHDPVCPSVFGYGPQSDSAESIDIYAPPSFPMHTYDAFEFHALHEHNNASAMLASQHA